MGTRIALCIIAALSLALGLVGELTPVQQSLRTGIALVVVIEAIYYDKTRGRA